MRRVLPGLFFTANNLSDLVDLVTNYRNHLKSIYELEMYYGDETIQFLMSHTTSLLEVLEDFDDVYSIATPIMYEESEEQTEEKGETEDGPTKINKENVFYAGTRRRNN
jgi:hypothetical protein